MEFFNIGNFIVLAILGTVIVVMRRFDQQNRTVDGVKRFLDRAKKEFDDHVLQSRERFFEMSANLDNFEKMSREALRRIEEDKGAIALEAENLNEVKSLVVQMLAEKEAVTDAIENLKKDSTYVIRINNKIEQTAAKALAVEEASERLLGELVDRNQKAMDAQKESLVADIAIESEAIREAMAEQTVAAEALKAELEHVLSQKESALVTSLKIFNAELERIQLIYTEHLKAIEAGAHAMESEGLRQVKENIDDQFEKVKNLTSSLFSQETLRFREKLEIQVNEFDVFAEKYHNMESALSERFEMLNNNVIRMESDYSYFNDQMRDLSGYMNEQFNSEAIEIKEIIGKETARMAAELEQQSQQQFNDVMDNITYQFSQVRLISSNINEKIAEVEAAYQHKEDQLNEKVYKLSGDIESMHFELANNYREAQKHQEQQLANLNVMVSNEKEHLEHQIEESITKIESLTQSQKELLLDKVGEQSLIIEQEMSSLKDSIKHQQHAIGGQFNDYKETITEAVNSEKRLWSSQLSLLKDNFNEMVQSSKSMVDSEIEDMLLASLAEVKDETEEKIRALTGQWSQTIKQSQAMAEALTLKESNFEDQLLLKIRDLDHYYNQVITDLHAKQRQTEVAYQHWDSTITQLSTLVEDELSHEKNSLRLALDEKVGVTEKELKDEWHSKISNFTVSFGLQVEEANSLLNQKMLILSREVNQLQEQHNQKMTEMSDAVTQLDSRLRHEADELNGSLQQKALIAENQSNAIASSYQSKMQENFDKWQDSALAVKASYDERSIKAQSYLDELAEAWENRFNVLNTELKVKSGEAQHYAEQIASEWKIQYNLLKGEVTQQLDAVSLLSRQFSDNSEGNFLELEALAAEKSEQIKDIISTVEQEWQERLGSFSRDIEVMQHKYLLDQETKFETIKQQLSTFEEQTLAEQQLKDEEWKKNFESWRLSVAEMWAEEQHRIAQKSAGSDVAVKSLEEMINFSLQQADSKTKEIEALWMQRFNSFEQDYDKQNESALYLADELKNNWDQRYQELDCSITDRFSHIFEQLSEKMDIKSSQLEQLYNEKESEARLLGDELTNLYRHHQADTKNSVEQIEQEWQGKYDGLNSSYNQMVISINESWHMKNSRLEAEAIAHQAKIDDYMAMIEHYYQDKRSNLDQFFGDQLASISDYGLRLTREQEVQYVTLKEQWLAGEQELSEHYQERLGEVSNLLAKNQQNIEFQVHNFNSEALRTVSTLSDTVEELNSKINQQSQTVEEAMQQRYNLFRENMENSLATVWDDFKLLRDDYSARLAQLEEISLSKEYDVSLKIDEHQALLSRKLAELEITIEQHLTQSNEQRLALQAELDEHVKQLSLEADQKIDLSRIKQDDITRQWHSRFTELDGLHQKSLNQAMGAITSLKEEWQSRLDDSNEELFNRITTVNNGVDEQLAQVDDRAELVEGAWAERYERYSDNLAKRLEKTENEIEEALGDWRTRLDGLQGGLDDRLGEANRLADEVAGRWRKSFEELQETMGERAKATQQQVDNLEEVWSERFTTAQTVITGRLDESKNWSKEIEERWMAEYERLEHGLSERALALNEASEEFKDRSIKRYEQTNSEHDLQVATINEQMHEQLGRIQEELNRETLMISEAKDGLGKLWEERFEQLRGYAYDQLNLVEEESSRIEHSWRSRFTDLNKDVENWIILADKAAKEEALALELLWSERFSQLTLDEEQRVSQANEYAQEVERFWQDKIASMNDDLEQRLTVVQSEANNYLDQLSVEWELKVKDAKYLLEQQVDAATFSSVKVEERWHEQYQQLIEKFGEHTKGANHFAEQLNDQWKKRYNDLNHSFEEQSKQLLQKSLTLNEAKDTIDKKISEFKELSITEIEQHRATMQSQLTEHLITLSNDMRSDWEERLGDLKTTFTQRIEQSKEAANSLEESRHLLEEEKNIFAQNLEEMASDALLLYQSGKERLNSAFDGLGDHLTSWQLGFTAEIRRLEDEALQRQHELKQLNAGINSDFSIFETALVEKQHMMNETIVKMKSDLEEERDLLASDNRGAMEQMINRFQKVGGQIEEQQVELDTLLRNKKSDAIIITEHFSQQLNLLIDQQQQLFKEQLDREAIVGVELAEGLRQQESLLQADYQRRLLDIEETWQAAVEKFADKDHTIDLLVERSIIEAQSNLAKIDDRVNESIESSTSQVVRLEEHIDQVIGQVKDQARQMAEDIKSEQQLCNEEATARLDAMGQNWDEVEQTIITQQKLYQDRIEERLEALAKESQNLTLSSEVQLESIRRLSNSIEQELISHGNELRQRLVDGIDGSDTIIANYHQVLQSYKDELRESMELKIGAIRDDWQQLLDEAKDLATGQQLELRKELDKNQNDLSSQQSDLNRQIVALEQSSSNIALQSQEQQLQLVKLYEQEKVHFEEMVVRRNEENERRWANLVADLDEKEVFYHKKIEQSMVLLRDKTDGLTLFYDTEKEALHRSFEERLHEINQSWLGFNERLGMKQNDFEQDFAGRVEIAEHRLSSLEDRLNLKQESFEASFGERLAASIENLKMVQNEFDHKQQDFDQSLATQMERAAVGLANLEQDFKEKRILFEEALATRIAGAGIQVDELTEVYQHKHLQLEEHFEERLHVTMSEVQSLEHALTLKTDQLKGLVEGGLSDAKEQLQTLSNELIVSSQAIFSELELRLTENSTTFSTRLASIEDSVTRRTDLLDHLYSNIQADFTDKKGHIDAMIEANQKKLLMTTEAISLQRDTIVSELSSFKAEISDFITQKDEQLRLLIGGQSVDVQEKVSKMVISQFEDADQRLNSIAGLLDLHEKETNSKLLSYRNQFINDVALVEELVGQAEFELSRKRNDFEEGRHSLESQMNVYRDTISSDLHRSEQELRALIHSSISQTGEDLSLEFMGTLESRLSDYEEAMKGKLGRMESFISDVDLLENSLRGSMSEVQDTILNEMSSFENEIRLRHERELERAASMLSNAQQEISNTIYNAQGSIGELKLQVDDLRRKALENVTGQLTDFEEGFLGEINKREEVIGFRMRDWQSRIEQAMESFQKRKNSENSEFEEKISFEQESSIRRVEERIQTEFSTFSNQISSFATELERRTRDTELEVNSLRETLAAKIDFFVSQADDQMAARLMLLQKELNSNMTLAETEVASTIKQLKQQFDYEKDVVTTVLKNYHSDIEVWRRRGDDAVNEHQDKFDHRFEELNSLFQDKIGQFDQQFKQLNGRAEQLISELSKSFTHQTNTLTEVNEDERRRLRHDFDALSSRASNVEISIEKKATLYLDKLSQNGDELMVSIDRKSKQAHQQIEDRLKELKGETKTIEGELVTLRGVMEKSIGEGTSQLATRLDQIEKRQQLFEANSPIFKQAEEMREVLERSLVDLAERMAKVEGRREEVIQLESQLSKAFKINESLAEKLSSMARERTRFDEIDGRIGHVMDLSAAVDQKLLQITNATATLQEVQARLRNLEEYEKGLQTKFEDLDRRAVVVESTASGIANNFDLMQQLERRINEAVNNYHQMASQLEQSRISLQEVGDQQPRIDYLLQFFQSADEKIVTMEDKITRIDQMRDWMVAAENRFTGLQDDIKTNMRALAMGSGSKEEKGRDKESGGEGDINDMVVKLALQSWGPEQIASHLKLSIAQVTLILDRHRAK